LNNKCDFCYADQLDWKAKLDCLPKPWLGWEFVICDSCRLLLRNVISVALHKMTQAQMVDAIQAKMDELGLTYMDLMGMGERKELMP
jgi:hypothetical protein